MKPDWKDAPKWAKWLAQDSDAWWFWYEHKPYTRDDIWLWRGDSKHSSALSSNTLYSTIDN